MQQRANDSSFKYLMASSRIEMPFDEFEDELMAEISRREKRKGSFAKNVTLSWIFFLAGTLFGVIITLLLPEVSLPLPGMASDLLITIFQVFFALFEIGRASCRERMVFSMIAAS